MTLFHRTLPKRSGGRKQNCSSSSIRNSSTSSSSSNNSSRSHSQCASLNAFRDPQKCTRRQRFGSQKDVQSSAGELTAQISVAVPVSDAFRDLPENTLRLKIATTKVQCVQKPSNIHTATEIWAPRSRLILIVRTSNPDFSQCACLRMQSGTLTIHTATDIWATGTHV